MAGLWYRAGTVAVTSGSKKVVGTGTLWKTAVYKPDKGHCVWGPDGKPYELDYVESDTVLYLVTVYAGATAAGQSYSIDITRTATIPALSREIAAQLAYAQGQYDAWQQILTGSGTVTLTAPDGQQVQIPSMTSMQQSSNSLQALMALVPAADKLPFFNGPKGAGVATFTALARTLLAGATDADMRGTLKVPGLYIGNKANMDFDTLTEPGIYRLGPSPLHGPSATADGRYSQVAVDRANTDTLTQAVAIYLTGELWVRTALFTGGVWVFQPWRKQFDTKNILGAVSQSGGIPTGAIFERVSNANGEGLKLPDGTLICWRTYTDTAHTTAANGAVFYKAMIGIAKPVTFVGAAVDFQAAIYRAGDTTMLRWVGNRGSSLTLSEWNFDSITAAAVTNVSASFMLISFGRWY